MTHVIEEPALRLWRILRAEDFLRVDRRRKDGLANCEIEAVVSALARVHPLPTNERDRDEYTAALNGDASCAIALAERAPTDDEHASWLVVAASRGAREAWGLLVDVFDGVRRRVERDGSASKLAEADTLDELRDEWAALFRDGPPKGGIAAILRPDGGVEELLNFSEDEDVETGSPGPSLVVVKAIGDRDTREGELLFDAYGALTRPLPLETSPIAPGLLAYMLTYRFPWAADAIALLRRQLEASAMSARGSRIGPTLFVGPPGSGKTSLAMAVGRLLGLQPTLLSVAASLDVRALVGTARGWASRQPAFPLLAMTRAKIANPLMIVDEIDKAAGRFEGRMEDALLAFLEPSTAGCWFDECLLGACDLSACSWLLTANDPDAISDVLTSRVEVVEVPRPSGRDLDNVLEVARRDLAFRMLADPEDLPMPPARVMKALRDALDQGANLRTVRRALERHVAHAGLQPRRAH
ncbi:AAA family ATPase [Roseiterribacter gracilis]|uniref:AAA+ ATPase domain-containing protein n=1 Tax=Roseiterribacter gracilis TaxID=2812848 RepID=A0A8S8XHK8_9PROT|nr:hypothetical protein TMPK1_29320 [Rhodospirillales bacterium TMPK1]